jgi:hypothetical protein
MLQRADHFVAPLASGEWAHVVEFVLFCYLAQWQLVASILFRIFFIEFYHKMNKINLVAKKPSCFIDLREHTGK